MKQAKTIANEWFKKYPYLKGDAFVCTQKEWQERREPYGNTALATIAIDGSPMYEALNYGEPNWTIQTQFNNFLQSHGYWYELGYAWTIHLYKA